MEIPDEIAYSNESVRDLLDKEITYRRERREQIFTWASSLLVAIIGGTIALTTQGRDSLGGRQQGGLCAAIGRCPPEC
jgi:hypothetical protein